MGFRTIFISNHCGLKAENGWLIIQSDKDKRRVFIEEIATLVIESESVSLTSYLLMALMKNGVTILFCDRRLFPSGQLLPLSENGLRAGHIFDQIALSQEKKDRISFKIIQAKIGNQASLLKKIGRTNSSLRLQQMSAKMTIASQDSMEALASRVYFIALFGKGFVRFEDDEINKKLNYGYAMLASKITTAICLAGFLPELGIHHCSKSNPYNLSYDLIEPLRPCVDYLVYRQIRNAQEIHALFGPLLSIEMRYGKTRTNLENAIPLYVRDVLESLVTEVKLNPGIISMIS